MEIMVDKGSKSGNLYIFDSKELHQIIYINNVLAQTWHQKLGHLSFKKMIHLKTLIPCITNKQSLSHVCPLAKQKKLPFTSNNNFLHISLILFIMTFGNFFK